MPKSTVLAAILLASVCVTGPAFAFSVESAPTNSDGSAKFTDPDDLADGMADLMSGGGTGASTLGYFHMFGSNGASVGFGMSQPSMGVVTSQGTLQRPYDPNDPTTKPY